MDNAIVINAIDKKGNKVVKSIAGINPAADNSDLSTFAKMANALTTNELVSVERVIKVDITNPEVETITPNDPVVYLDI